MSTIPSTLGQYLSKVDGLEKALDEVLLPNNPHYQIRYRSLSFLIQMTRANQIKPSFAKQTVDAFRSPWLSPNTAMLNVFEFSHEDPKIHDLSFQCLRELTAPSPDGTSKLSEPLERILSAVYRIQTADSDL